MEQSDRVAPPPGLAAFDEDAVFDDGYNQDDHYGHNQDFLLLRDPRKDNDDSSDAEPPHRERRRRSSGIGLGTAGAAGIPDSTGHVHTGFGDPDRD